MSALSDFDKVTSLSERRELSEAAKALLLDKAFAAAFKQLKQRWWNQVIEQPHAGELQNELIARMRALDAIPTELSAIIESYRHDQAQKARHG
jgi:uncharacterized protein HemY